MSNLIIESSLPKSSDAIDLASSVLPTPVGPTNIKDGGRFLFLSPARFLLIALQTAVTALSWPIKCLWILASKFNNFVASVSDILEEGIFVQFSITFATSSTESSSSILPCEISAIWFIRAV